MRRIRLVVGTDGKVQPVPRGPHDVVRGLAPAEEARPSRPKPHDKRVSAGIATNGHEVIADASSEAQRRDPQRTRR